MSLKLWTNDISKAYIGSTEVSKAYLGSTLVYSSIPPNWLLNNLVSYYKMDTNGSFPDAHWSNNWTINGASFTTNGKINWAYDFDGVNDWIDTWASFNATWAFTISWYFKSSLTWWTTDKIFYYWNIDNSPNIYESIQLQIINSGKVEYIDYDWVNTIITSSWTYTDNLYHSFMIIDNWTTVEVFIDNVSIWSWTSRKPLITWTNLFLWKFWSNRWGISWDFFSGSIDEFWIWQTNLDTTRRNAWYNSWNWLSYDDFTT